MIKPIESQAEQSAIDIDTLDDTQIKVIFLMSKATWKRLGEIALNRETSRASLVREAILQYMEKLEKPEEQNPKIPDRQLNRIIKECTKDDNEGFEIDGEDGFIEQMKAKGFKLKDSTPEQWEKVKEKLEIGYKGYFSPPSLEEFAEKFEVLEPSEEQKTWLSTAEEETEETED
ncbi:MAG: hypothetical protein QHH18_03235 [Candidatus Bathyarchaeota archaeon]|jgi:hypothetical protein|nr:hypothetical protein [Candidatus Bathyarchaeota archaeon A05DMB-5]MDH7557606.1 hypothetical protein [Candidatus Bathyarchaeota archaeon]